MHVFSSLAASLVVIGLLVVSTPASAQGYELHLPSSYQTQQPAPARARASRAMRIVGEGLAWTGGAIVATGVGTTGFMLMAFNSQQASFGALVLAAGIATGIFGIPWAVWLAGGRDGSYWTTVAGNLLGAGLGVGWFATFWRLAETTDFVGFAIAGIVGGVVLNMGGAILSFEWSRSSNEPHQGNHATLLPTIAPTPTLDGVTLGVAELL